MAGGEKGFVYPMALSVLASACLMLLFTAEIMLIEKKFAAESEALLIQEYYLADSLKKTEAGLNGGDMDMSGSYAYSKGHVSYISAADSPGILKITFKVELDGRDPVESCSYYDITQQKMIKWVERY